MKRQKLTGNTIKNNAGFRALCGAIHAVDSEQQLAELLCDVGTVSELQAWSERLEVAKQLSRGLSYRQVSANTGASTTTVTRVARAMEEGSGYQAFLRKASARFNQPEEPKKDAGLRKYL